MTAAFHVGFGDQNKNSKQDNRTYDNDDDYWKDVSLLKKLILLKPSNI